MVEPFISGYALQWGRPATIGGAFVERFERGAFDKSLRDHPDVAALWAHDTSRPLGRVSNGSLTLKVDSIGLWYSLVPNLESPSGQEAVAAVGRSDVGQVSVGFSAIVEEWADNGELPSRKITEARLWELSLVLWGAYGDATSASLTRAEANAANASRRRAEAAMRRRGISA